MLHTASRDNDNVILPEHEPIELCTIALSPLADGHFFVSIKYTIFDEMAFELIDREVVSERKEKIAAVLAVVGDSLHTSFGL